MKLYELVAIIDPQMSQEDQQWLITQIEWMLPEWSTIEQKDDIGLQKVYQFNATKAWVAYFVSWYVRLNEQDIVALKRKLSLVKWILRSVVYVVDKHNPMVSFKTINETYVTRLQEIEKKSKKVKLAV